MSAEITLLPAPSRPPVQAPPAQPAAQPLREPVHAVLKTISSVLNDRPNFVAGENRIAFDNAFARTTVSFTPVDVPTPDGCRVTGIAEVRTELPENLHVITDMEMAFFNTVAALGALLRDPASGKPVIVSRAALLVGDEQMLDRYGLLLHAAVLAHPDQLVTAFMFAEEGKVRPGAEFPRRPAGTPSPWDAAEFESVAGLIRQRGYCANAGATGVRAELDWAPGQVSAMAGDSLTSRLTLSATSPHPLFGDGLFCKLELPVAFPQDRVVELVNALNQLDSQAIDAPPFFGAWCAVLGTPRIAWVSFLPDGLYQPGLAGSVAGWMVMRHRIASEVICSRRA